jgi:hypothetical protein
MRRCLHARRITLVHTNNDIRTHRASLLACLSLRIPYVCHLRDRFALTPLEIFLANRAGRVVCISEFIQGHYEFSIPRGGIRDGRNCPQRVV